MLAKPGFKLADVPKYRARAEFFETARALSPGMTAIRQHAHEWHSGCLRSAAIVNVVAQVQRGRRIAAIENREQSFGIGLRVPDIFHRHNFFEYRANTNSIECVIEFGADASSEQR